MTKYQPAQTLNFRKDMKQLKGHHEVQKRLLSKIQEICDNPHHYKHLRNNLKGQQRIHIGSFVLTFEVVEPEEKVIFHTFCHHDEAYS